MESNQQADPNQLTSYLKSMFTQFNGEEPTPVPASRPPTKDFESVVENEVSPSDRDINNNSKPPAPPAPPSPLPNGTIKVDVIVHNSDSVQKYEHSLAPVQQPSTNYDQETNALAERAIVGHNKISLSFLDELKHTLQINKPQEQNDDDEAVQAVVQSQQAHNSSSEDANKESLGQQSLNQPNELDSKPEVQQQHQPMSNGSLEPPVPPANDSYASSVQDDESANEEVSVESGIELDDQSSIASESNNNHNNNHYSRTTETAPDSSNRSTLTRSVSTDLNGSSATGRKVIMRSISQDVKFKLESIKEEKKVTKTHVSELANFWKGRMISPKDKE